MRIDDLEQRLGEARKLGVELELHARRQKPDAFEQPLDVGIGDLQPVHAEPGGDLRKLLGELGAHLAQMLQLEVVVLEQARIHHATRDGARSAIWTFPVSRSISVRTRNSSGTGCAQSCAVNLDADHVVVIELAGLEQRPDLQRGRQDARLEVEDRLADGAREVGHVERGRRLPGQRRQPEIHHRPAHVGRLRQIGRPPRAAWR